MTKKNTRTTLLVLVLAAAAAGHFSATTAAATASTAERSSEQQQRRILHNPDTGAVTYPLIPHAAHLERRRRELREANGGADVDEMKLPPRPRTSRHSPPSAAESRDDFAAGALRDRFLRAGNDGDASDRRLQQQMGALYQGYGTHYVDLWVGTPTPQRQTVIVDTGSGVTAFPCSGCEECGHISHTDQYFVESQSSTFRTLSCDECHRGQCADMRGERKCRISMSYAEGSSWKAYEGIDKCYAGGPHDRPLEISNDPSDGAVEDFDHVQPVEASEFAFDLAFGCQMSITGLFITQLADGIMGMENGKNAFWKQMYTAQAIPLPEFSLCYSRQDDPNKSGVGAGAMTLGGVDKRLHAGPMIFTENVNKGGGYYNVHLKSVYLRAGGGISAQVTSDQKDRIHKLAVDEGKLNHGNVIIDSGTTDTYFTSAISDEFKKAWKSIVGNDYNHNAVSLTKEELAQLPTVIFVIKGHPGSVEPDVNPDDTPGFVGSNSVLDGEPDDVVLAVPASHYMEFDSNLKKYVARVYVEERGGSVLGANTMMGHDVYFDVDGGRVGWAESNCDYDLLVNQEESVSVAPETKKSSSKTEVHPDDSGQEDSEDFDEAAHEHDFPTGSPPGPGSQEGNQEGSVSVVPETKKSSIKTEVHPDDSGEEDSEDFDEAAHEHDFPTGSPPGPGSREGNGVTILADIEGLCETPACQGIAAMSVLLAIVLVTVVIRRTTSQRRVVQQYQVAELEISDLVLNDDLGHGRYSDEPSTMGQIS